MKRKGRPRLAKVHEVRSPPTLSGNIRTWFLRRPEDVNIGGVGGPQTASTPVRYPYPYWLRWIGFAVIVAAIRWAHRRAQRTG
jgi:hypothetical protein